MTTLAEKQFANQITDYLTDDAYHEEGHVSFGFQSSEGASPSLAEEHPIDLLEGYPPFL